MDRMLDFGVTVSLGGKGGLVCVSVPVSDEEYELLKLCYLDDCEPQVYDGLEDLCSRVEEAAIDEAKFIAGRFNWDGDHKSAFCLIWMPYAIVNECEAELEERET